MGLKKLFNKIADKYPVTVYGSGIGGALLTMYSSVQAVQAYTGTIAFFGGMHAAGLGTLLGGLVFGANVAFGAMYLLPAVAGVALIETGLHHKRKNSSQKHSAKQQAA